MDRENKIAGVIPRLVFKDKSTYVQSSTKIYDDVSEIFTYVLYSFCGTLLHNKLLNLKGLYHAFLKPFRVNYGLINQG